MNQIFNINKKDQPNVKTNRPINLDLTSMKFPPMAIASILHRLSGLAIFILLPYIFYLLQKSLRSISDFEKTVTMLQSWIPKSLVFVFLAALIYHALAGVRHIFMDMGFGESLSSARRSAIGVITLSILLTILAGLWLC